MTLTRPRTAWILSGLQLSLSILFYKELKTVLPPGLQDVYFWDGPPWFAILNTLNFGLSLLLALFALWKFEITAIVYLLALHIVCPVLFFTDLTRNPYVTQITLFNIWISFLWIAQLAEAIQKKVFVFPRTALNLPLFAFLGAASLSWGLSFLQHSVFLHPAMIWEGLRHWVFLVINVMGVFFIAYRLDPKWQKRFLWVTFWVAGGTSAYGLMQFYGIERVWEGTMTPFGNRPISTFGNPNFLSSYLLLVAAPLTVSFLISKTFLKSWTSLTLLVIILMGIIATMTRSTWVGTIVAMGILPLSPQVRELIRANLKKFIILSAILLASVVFWPKSNLGGYRNPWERLIELKDIGTGKAYQPWSQRILIWNCSFLMVQDHPLLGKGWGLMENFYPYYQGKMLFHPILRGFRTHANNSHNEVLEIWSQTGTIGLGIYVWLWVILIAFGLKLAQATQARDPPNFSSVWGWALTASAVGMLVDNFFGNVSLHFCIPAFLFWWQAGLLFGMSKTPLKKSDQESSLDYHILPISNHFKMLLLWVGIVFFSGSAALAFRKEFQEIFYFSGFKLSKAAHVSLEAAREQLERAWRWFPREVNTNYELANTYARLAQQARTQGIAQSAESFRQKAVWAYLESIRSNAGYDEIYANLAATLASAQWNEDKDISFEVPTPDGRTAKESAQDFGGAITNFSRSLLINPMSLEGYNYLASLYLQDRVKYLEQRELLFQQSVYLYPKNRDFWLNLALTHIEKGEFGKAMENIAPALTIDPFYEITRKNLHLLAARKEFSNHPLAQVDQILSQLNRWIQTKNWPVLKEKMEFCIGVLPECAGLHLILANVCFELRQLEQAQAAYNKTLELDPSNVSAAHNLALTYSLQGKTSEARAAYESVLKLNPGHPEAKKALESLPKS